MLKLIKRTIASKWFIVQYVFPLSVEQGILNIDVTGQLVYQ